MTSMPQTPDSTHDSVPDSTTPRPVVALDVDGVLNPKLAWTQHPDDPERWDPQPLPGFRTERVHVPAADVPDSPFVRGYGSQDMQLTVQLNAEHAAWIAQLRQRADVVWATTWEHVANTVLAPLLGIEPLEVATCVRQDPPRFGWVREGNSAAWKADVLEQRYPGRPLVWVDDQAWGYQPREVVELLPGATEQEKEWHADELAERDRWAWRRPDPTLVLVPEPREGLVAAHRDAIEAFLVTHGH